MRGKIDEHDFFDLDEKREETRVNLDADIFIETVSQEPGETNSPVIVKCECVDLSANGMQVILDTKLHTGAIHTLLIEIKSLQKIFRLTAEIRWTSEKNNRFLTGLFLYDSDGTEIIDWKFMMAKYLV